MGKQRLLSLDALKGVAILMVIWGHFYLFGDVDTLSTASYLHRFILAVHMSVFVLTCLPVVSPVETVARWAAGVGRYLGKSILVYATPLHLLCSISHSEKYCRLPSAVSS